MKHIVSFSGGIGSFVTAHKIIEKYGKDDVILVFADTLIEDEDLYRFIEESFQKFGVKYVWLKDGRNPWEVFRDVKYMGNSRIAQCSRILKTKQVEDYIKSLNEDIILYLGIDWTEIHRLEGAKKRWNPLRVESPLCEEPYLNKQDMRDIVESYGIKIPRLYDYGFSHNNCGGFCVRAGQAQFKNLLEKFPERYLWHESQQESLFKDQPNLKPFLKKNKNNQTYYLKLKEFREMIQTGEGFDKYDFGGCGCFVDD